jgi:hypothetical protein
MQKMFRDAKSCEKCAHLRETQHWINPEISLRNIWINPEIFTQLAIKEIPHCIDMIISIRNYLVLVLLVSFQQERKVFLLAIDNFSYRFCQSACRSMRQNNMNILLQYIWVYWHHRLFL